MVFAHIDDDFDPLGGFFAVEVGTIQAAVPPKLGTFAKDIPSAFGLDDAVGQSLPFHLGPYLSWRCHRFSPVIGQ
jgi:hypothetical protein